MNSSVFSVTAGVSLNVYNVSTTNSAGMSFDDQTDISKMNINLFTNIILMTSMLNIHPSIADLTTSSPTWSLTPSLNTAFLTTPTFVTNSTEKSFNLTSTEILQAFSSTMKQVSSVASTTLTPITVDIETSNASLKWFLQFDLSGKIEMTFVENLKNPKSKEFANLSALLITEFLETLRSNPPVETIIKKFSNGSVLFDATLYFNFTSNINVTSLKTNLTNGGLKIQIISFQERCSLLSCSGKGVCEENKTLICRCELGYRGDRCNESYPINGTQRIWTNWTSCTKSCSNGTQTRTGVCYPKPIHGGICLLGDEIIIENSFCNTNYCPVKHEKEDYILVAIICGTILLLILILLFCYCCSHAYNIPMKSARSNANDTLDYDLAKAKDITDSIRLQSSLRQHSRSSHLSSHLNVKKSGKTPWKDDLNNKYEPSADGLDNPIYYEDFVSSEAIYKKQLKRFLKEASDMSKESSKPVDDRRPLSQQPIALTDPGKISVDDTDVFSQTKSKSTKKMKPTSKQPDKKQFIIDSKERSLVLV